MRNWLLVLLGAGLFFVPSLSGGQALAQSNLEGQTLILLGSSQPSASSASPPSSEPGLPEGLSLKGVTNGMLSFDMPQGEDLARYTARSLLEIYEDGESPITAEAMASLAAGSVGSPRGLDLAFDERTDLVLALYVVDGTDELTRKFVRNVHMKMILTEVFKYIDISKLSEAEKGRLAAISVRVIVDLENKILLLEAQNQASVLNKADILKLISDFDNEAQRKLTRMRAEDDGAIDRRSDLAMKAAHYNILRDFNEKESSVSGTTSP
jgi:hypothetical protein